MFPGLTRSMVCDQSWPSRESFLELRERADCFGSCWNAPALPKESARTIFSTPCMQVRLPTNCPNIAAKHDPGFVNRCTSALFMHRCLVSAAGAGAGDAQGVLERS